MDLIATQQVKTMSTREIADVTGKEYQQVIHDTFELLCGLDEDFFAYGDFAESVNGAPQVLQGCFRLPANLLFILAGSYGTDAALAIYDAWRDREAEQAEAHMASVMAIIDAQRKQIEENRALIGGAGSEVSVRDRVSAVFAARPGDKKTLPRLRTTYLVKHPLTGLIKIGRAVDPARRIAGIGTQSGAALEVLQLIYTDCERDLHKRFAEIRVHGEWFKDDGQIRAFCASLMPVEA